MKVISRLRPVYQATKIRKWREYRRMTQDQLAEWVGAYLEERGIAKGYSYATIGRLERGLIPYKQPVMEAIADVLDTTVPALIVRDPGESEGLMEMIDRASPDRKLILVDMLRGATRK